MSRQPNPTQDRHCGHQLTSAASYTTHRDTTPAPGEERWLVCEHSTTGERKFHLANQPADATLEQLAAALKSWWSCEQAHQQLNEELDLDHYERRSWPGLHHHALLCQIAHTSLQSL